MQGAFPYSVICKRHRLLLTAVNAAQVQACPNVFLAQCASIGDSMVNMPSLHRIMLLHYEPYRLLFRVIDVCPLLVAVCLVQLSCSYV